GLRGDELQCHLLRLYALAALGEDLEKIVVEVERLYSQAPDPVRVRFRRSVGLRLMRIGLLRGRPDWSRRIVSAYGLSRGEPEITETDLILLADEPNGAGDWKWLDDVADRVLQIEDCDYTIQELVRFHLDPHRTDPAPSVALARRWFAQPMLTTSSLL